MALLEADCGASQDQEGGDRTIRKKKGAVKFCCVKMMVLKEDFKRCHPLKEAVTLC